MMRIGCNCVISTSPPARARTKVLPSAFPLGRRDGLERVEVPDTATVQDLHAAVEAQLKVPAADQIFSRDQKLVRGSNGLKFLIRTGLEGSHTMSCRSFSGGSPIQRDECTYIILV